MAPEAAGVAGAQTGHIQHSGKNLDINFISTDRGAQAIRWPINGGANQMWRPTITGL